MKLAGIDHGDDDVVTVETIDVWYSDRRRAWIVERLDTDGNQIGLSHRCAAAADAAACVAEWLRTHETIRLFTPRPLTSAEQRVLVRGARRAA